MKQVLSFFLLLSLIATLFACSSGKQALQRGNYEESVMKSINRLRNNPNHKKGRETFRQAYALTVDYHLDRIALLKASGEAFRWEGILNSYNTLTRLHNEVQRCPACLQEAPRSRSYLNEANEAKYNAAVDRYQAGVQVYARDNSRQSAKEAYLHFRQVLEFVSDYKDTRAKMNEAYHYATLKVVLEQI